MSHRPTAVYIKDVPGFTGEAGLYRCIGGQLPEYVVVSATHVPYIHRDETYIFAADATGVVTDWRDLPGSVNDTLDHEAALQGAGYEVVYEQ